MKKLIIQQEAYQKLRAYIDNCPSEISGLGKIEIVPNGFLVTDIMILKQTVTNMTTKLDDNALGKWCYELTKAGDDVAKWCLWWHSHVDMGAYFSGTDVETIEESTDMPHLISLVGNLAGEWEARLDIFKPHHATNNLKVMVENLIDKKITESCMSQIKELVQDKIVPTLAGQKRSKRRSKRQRRIMREQRLLMTPREKYLVQKSDEGTITDEETNEIIGLMIDTDASETSSMF